MNKRRYVLLTWLLALWIIASAAGATPHPEKIPLAVMPWGSKLNERLYPSRAVLLRPVLLAQLTQSRLQELLKSRFKEPVTPWFAPEQERLEVDKIQARALGQVKGEDVVKQYQQPTQTITSRDALFSKTMTAWYLEQQQAAPSGATFKFNNLEQLRYAPAIKLRREAQRDAQRIIDTCQGKEDTDTVGVADATEPEAELCEDAARLTVETDYSIEPREFTRAYLRIVARKLKRSYSAKRLTPMMLWMASVPDSGNGLLRALPYELGELYRRQDSSSALRGQILLYQAAEYLNELLRHLNGTSPIEASMKQISGPAYEAFKDEEQRQRMVAGLFARSGEAAWKKGTSADRAELFRCSLIAVQAQQLSMLGAKDLSQ